MADFEQKEPKRAELKKIVSLHLSSLILGSPRNGIIFPLPQTKIVFLASPIPSKSENYWGTIFFLSGRIFLLILPKSFAKS